MKVIPLDRPHVVPYLMPPRFKTEIELTEDHEAWLKWMVEHEIQHVRLET